MIVTPETKSEIIVVGIAGVVLVLLWAANRSAGAGTGLETLPILSQDQPQLAGGAPTFNIPAPVPGFTGTYTGAPWSLPGPNDFSFGAGQPSACNCAGNSQAGSTFGSNTDLASWLASQPDVLSNAVNSLTNWN